MPAAGIAVCAALAALATLSGCGGHPGPAEAAAEPAQALPREYALADQLLRERRAGARAERRLIRRVRSARADLGELAEPLGRAPRLRWPRFPDHFDRETRLAKQLTNERVTRADRRFWLSRNLRANRQLLTYVRHPTPAGNRALASAYFGWEYPCAAVIIYGETAGTWRHDVWNYEGSGAYGLGQAMPRSKMLRYGSDAYVNPLTQLRWFAAYSRERYGSVCGAAAHWSPAGSW